MPTTPLPPDRHPFMWKKILYYIYHMKRTQFLNIGLSFLMWDEFRLHATLYYIAIEVNIKIKSRKLVGQIYQLSYFGCSSYVYICDCFRLNVMLRVMISAVRDFTKKRFIRPFKWLYWNHKVKSAVNTESGLFDQTFQNYPTLSEQACQTIS